MEWLDGEEFTVQVVSMTPTTITVQTQYGKHTIPTPQWPGVRMVALGMYRVRLVGDGEMEYIRDAS